MVIRCPVCKNEKFKILFKSQDRLRRRNDGTHQIVKCSDCELVFLFPQSRVQDYDNNYGPSYISHVVKDRDVIAKINPTIENLRADLFRYSFGFPNDLSKNFSFLYRFFLVLFSFTKSFRYYPLQFSGKSLRILDVGCGVGKFLNQLKQRGWNAYGIEPSDAAVASCCGFGLNVKKGFLVSEYWREPYFDVVVLNQVFEHVDNSLSVLDQLYNVIKKDGVVMMNVPNMKSAAAYFFKSYWFNLDTPRHNLLFSPNVLISLLKKKGFDVKFAYTASSTKGWTGSLEYLLRDIFFPKLKDGVLRKNKILNTCFLPVVRLCDWFKIGDNMFILASKR